MSIIKPNPKIAGQAEVVTALVSFETGEQAQNRIYFPQAVRITSINAQVVKAIAATDAATITGANSTGASSGGVVTIPLSSAVNTVATPAVPTTNNVVPAGSYYQLTSAKTTAGGKALVTLQYVTN